jgi:hypothetical protein
MSPKARTQPVALVPRLRRSGNHVRVGPHRFDGPTRTAWRSGTCGVARHCARQIPDLGTGWRRVRRIEGREFERDLELALEIDCAKCGADHLGWSC